MPYSLLFVNFCEVQFFACAGEINKTHNEITRIGTDREMDAIGKKERKLDFLGAELPLRWEDYIMDGSERRGRSPS